MISLQAQLMRFFLRRFVAKNKQAESTPEASRRLVEHALGRMPVPAAVVISQIQVGDVAVEIVRPRVATDTGRVMMYVHGGGYVTGSPQTHRAFTARLALELQCEVWVPDYRLAPEHPFPAGLEDVYAVWVGFVQQHKGKILILGGESAGGGLSLALCYLARRRRVSQPHGLYLQSPWLDLQMAGDSYRRNEGSDILTSTRTTELSFARHYAGSYPRTDPLLSPLYGDPTGLPSTYVQVSDTEIFEDDSRSFVAQALIAGVDVTLEVGHGLWHAWPLFAPFLPEATRSIRHFGDWVRKG